MSMMKAIMMMMMKIIKVIMMMMTLIKVIMDEKEEDENATSVRSLFEMERASGRGPLAPDSRGLPTPKGTVNRRVKKGSPYS
jgi:hypothetical protein